MGETYYTLFDDYNINNINLNAKLIFSSLFKIKTSYLDKYEFCDQFNSQSIDCSNLKKVIEFISCKSAIKLSYMKSSISLYDQTIKKNIESVLNNCNNDYIKESLKNILSFLTSYSP
ncbi:hypothetical protein Calag_0271 [Caldisphaera lagunensis DSM 15908]|uniref:Uncharacterized protein n=1 Tax=Caldisphaera lagunensis (strain DSM 15908 / JCM 11604 / ANMR 0165 / IC-154) TaxID=1056495 RepID=L0A890_CALLD|nr:hypothetical protein [Caldisphaera lagunensis]AFZ70051.1 hypothetical protein Calag_0271 [Caldisphaera lagunensis DSM 15908]